jgi:hypothetical protein
MRVRMRVPRPDARCPAGKSDYFRVSDHGLRTSHPHPHPHTGVAIRIADGVARTGLPSLWLRTAAMAPLVPRPIAVNPALDDCRDYLEERA